MSDIDLDGLAVLAQAATPGPWTADVLGSEGYAVNAERPASDHRLRRRLRVARCGHEEWETDKANAAFIAACDPDTILALRERVREAEAERRRDTELIVDARLEAVERGTTRD